MLRVQAEEQLKAGKQTGMTCELRGPDGKVLSSWRITGSGENLKYEVKHAGGDWATVPAELAVKTFSTGEYYPIT